MFNHLIQALFGCWHRNCSFPITVKANRHFQGARRAGTYVVCLDCGKEIPYDWKTMKASFQSQSAVRTVSRLAQERP